MTGPDPVHPAHRTDPAARGRAARKRVPRSAHAGWIPSVGRPRPRRRHDFTLSYADQTVHDHATLGAAVAAGVVSADPGV